MVCLHIFLFWLSYMFPLVACYSWTLVEPNQAFPLPELSTPEILPDPEGPSQNVSETSVSLQSRWVSPLSDKGPKTPWPLSGMMKPFYRVRFCYADEETKKKASCTLTEALNIWATALGGGPGKDTGHNLGFVEYRILGQIQFCYREYDHQAETGKLNRMVSSDALAVYWKDTKKSGGVSFGTVGFTPKRYATDIEGYRHYLIMAENAPPTVIAHEIGHVLGMYHEMARADRDEYVEFRCSKLRDYVKSLDRVYEDAKNKGLSTDLQYLRDKLCTDESFAREAEFSGFNFIIQPTANYDHSSGLDYDSIMIYDSTTFGNDECWRDFRQCPMVKIIKENGVKVGEEAINRQTLPSPGDVAFVRKHYPWKG